MTTHTIAQKIPAGTYVVDPIHSSVGFSVRHNGVSTFRSGFGQFEARLSGGEGQRLEGTVDVASVEIPEEQLKAHLLSPEFFDAGRHPKLRFTSTDLSVDDGGELRLSGDLEIGGEKHTVEASGRFASLGEDAYGKGRVGLSLAAAVDRRRFGLDWQAELPSGGQVLDYEVEIAVELELVEEAA